jgi:hypothetical protein
VVTGPGLDGGGGDAGAIDGGGLDAGTPDGGRLDAGSGDGGRVDAGGLDGGSDGGLPDAGGADGGLRDAGPCTLSFAPTETQAGTGVSLVRADFDHDGRPDFAWTNPFQDELGVVLNSATGLRPVTRTRFPNGHWPAALGVGDVDLDGFDDLVVGAFFANQLVVARNDQQGRFSLTTTYPLANVWSIAGAQLDGQPGDDFAVAAQSTDLLVLRNVNGALAMPNPWTSDAGLSAFGVCVVDLRRQGVRDVVLLSGLGPGLVSVFRNDGSARFTLVERLTIPGRPGACSAGDLDGDGEAELFVATQDPSVEVFRGTGAGGLAPFTTLPGLKSENAPAIADLDRDGRAELLVSSDLADGGVFVVRALADGGLSPAQRLQPGPSSASAVVVGDVDGDGLPDVVGVGPGGTFVMPNRCR